MCGYCVLYLDIKRAYNTVLHNFLLLKLRKLGISNTLLKCIEAFLKHGQ